MKKKIVLSGIRATGKMHLGNYIGVLKNLAKFSKDQTKECFIFVADLHTLTTLKEAEQVKVHLPEIILDLLAAGVDYEQASLYAQSSVPEICELAWLLACLTPVNDLLQMPTYKDKSEKQPDDVNGGLLFYPVLMAADILGPRANIVPVGKDQHPHLELTALLAKKFNRLFGEFFPIPYDLKGEMVLVPGLEIMNQDGSFSKMGKSDNNTINLLNSPEEIWQKIRVAPTDPARIHRSDPGTAQNCVIFALHGFISSTENVKDCFEGCRTAKIGCIDCKKILANNIITLLSPFQEARQELSKNKGIVKEILVKGAKKIRPIITDTVNHVREKMGIVKF